MRFPGLNVTKTYSNYLNGYEEKLVHPDQFTDFQLAGAPAFAGGSRGTKPQEVTAADLPKEGQKTLVTIKQGGPFPYKRDGTVFGNFERRLPEKGRDYYREYTVPTPGLRNRGARRIIVGRGSEYYYTADHYQTFYRIRE